MKIIITRGCRSDYPVSDPIIKKMEGDNFFELNLINLYVNGSAPKNFSESFNIMDHVCCSYKPDLVMIVGDRIEQAGACNAVFLNNVPICHVGAGIINVPISTYDDILRHNITLMANIALCEDQWSAAVVFTLWSEIGRMKKEEIVWTEKIQVIGNLYAEGLDDIDDSLVPPVPYDLILINPTTLIEDNMPSVINSENAIIIGPNPDISLDKSFDYNSLKKYETYHNLPRSKFLGLLKNCSRFISNSSSIYSEAPYYLRPEQIIQIGNRNKDRSTDMDFEKGASDKVIKILKEWWRNKNETI